MLVLEEVVAAGTMAGVILLCNLVVTVEHLL